MTIDPAASLLSEFEAAARAVSGGAVTLVRTGSAALFRRGSRALRVTGPTVSREDVEAEARLSRWLSDQGVPTVPTLETHAVDSYHVAVMPWVESVRQADGSDAGRAAAKMHTLSPPAWLRPFDPLAVTRARVDHLRGSNDLSAEESEIVDQGMAKAVEAWETEAGSQPATVVHGDLTAHNILVSSTGPLVHDFENSGAGPGVWDLVRPNHGASRFVGRGAADRESFFQAYRSGGGRIPAEETLARLDSVVDVIGAVWCLYGRAVDYERFHAEAAVRLATVADGGAPAPSWHAI